MSKPIFAHKIKITDKWTEGADVLATFKRHGFVPPSEVVTQEKPPEKELEQEKPKQ
jgi:hypothetical protein